MGDFDRDLQLAVELSGARPHWLRPRRSLADQMMGRMGDAPSALPTLAAGVQRLLAGGIYYLEPSYLMGEYLEGLE